MKINETHPREKGFVLWGHCQNILDDPRKGIGKDSSPQSPAMNFDRSAVSLRLYIRGTECGENSVLDQLLLA